MTESEFIDWLKGYFDAIDRGLTKEQADKIRSTLNAVTKNPTIAWPSPNQPYQPVPWINPSTAPYAPTSPWMTWSTSSDTTTTRISSSLAGQISQR